MEAEPRPAIRAMALLFSVAVAGGLIGFGWERFTYEEQPEPVPYVPPEVQEVLSPREQRTPAEEAVLERALSNFPPYPNASRPEVLAADYLGPESPIAVAWFSTKDTPDQVLSHYNGTLLDAGLPVIGERYSKHAGYVGYWSPSRQEVHLVSALAQGGETTVFVSSGQVDPQQDVATRVPEWIPLPPDVAETTALTFLMEGATQYAVSGQVETGTVLEVAESFQRTFGERGWSVNPAGAPGDTEAELRLHRGSVRGMVLLRRSPPLQRVEVYLSLTERMQTAPPEGSAKETSR